MRAERFRATIQPQMQMRAENSNHKLAAANIFKGFEFHGVSWEFHGEAWIMKLWMCNQINNKSEFHGPKFHGSFMGVSWTQFSWFSKQNLEIYMSHRRLHKCVVDFCCLPPETLCWWTATIPRRCDTTIPTTNLISQSVYRSHHRNLMMQSSNIT